MTEEQNPYFLDRMQKSIPKGAQMGVGREDLVRLLRLAGQSASAGVWEGTPTKRIKYPSYRVGALILAARKLTTQEKHRGRLKAVD